MFEEITTEILELSRDFKFIRNLSCTSIIAIACLFSLSDLQSKSDRVLLQNSSTSMLQIETKSFIQRRMN